MSIAPNVGGLSRTRASREYVARARARYRGPIDCHDLDALLAALALLREGAGPTLLHVKTRRAGAIAPAEADPYRWHATVPSIARAACARARSGGPLSWTARSPMRSRASPIATRASSRHGRDADGTGLDRFAERHPTACTRSGSPSSTR